MQYLFNSNNRSQTKQQAVLYAELKTPETDQAKLGRLTQEINNLEKKYAQLKEKTQESLQKNGDYEALTTGILANSIHKVKNSLERYKIERAQLQNEIESKSRLARAAEQVTQEFNDQFFLALVKMLVDEVTFRLKCRADEESQKWFSGSTALLNVVTYEFQKIEAGDDSTMLIAILKQYINCVEIEAHKNNFSVSIRRLVNLITQWKKEDDGLIESVEKVELVDSVLTNRRNALCSLAQDKRKEIKAYIAKQKEIKGIEENLGFNTIPGYKEMSVEDKRHYESLYLCARLPVLMLEFPRKKISQKITDSSSSLVSSLPERILHQASNQENTALEMLHTKIKTAIVKMYDPENALPKGISIASIALKEHVQSKIGGWNWVWPWNWFRPSEYQTISRLLKALEEPVTDSVCVDALRRIRRLSNQYAHDVNKQKALSDMQIAFEEARIAAYAPEVEKAFVKNKEQITASKILERSEANLVEYNSYVCNAYCLNNNDSIISNLWQVKNEEKLPGQANSPGAVFSDEHLPDNLSDLQALVYFITHQHLAAENIGNEIILPVTWASQTGLCMTESLLAGQSLYSGLLNILEPLSKYKSLYFSVMIFSIVLINAKSIKDDYELLRTLLEAILSEQFSLHNLDLVKSSHNFNKGLGWLFSYIPAKIVFPTDNLDKNKLSVIKNALVGEHRANQTQLPIFPEPIRQASVDRNRLSSFSDTSAYAHQHNSSTPERDKVVIEQAYQYAEAIQARTHHEIRRIISAKMKASPSANRDILTVLALLEWYRTTTRGGERIFKSKQLGGFVSSWKAMEKRLNQAVTGLETVFPKDFAQLIPATAQLDSAVYSGTSLERFLTQISIAAKFYAVSNRNIDERKWFFSDNSFGDTAGFLSPNSTLTQGQDSESFSSETDEPLSSFLDSGSISKAAAQNAGVFSSELNELFHMVTTSAEDINSEEDRFDECFETIRKNLQYIFSQQDLPGCITSMFNLKGELWGQIIYKEQDIRSQTTLGLLLKEDLKNNDVLNTTVILYNILCVYYENKITQSDKKIKKWCEDIIKNLRAMVQNTPDAPRDIELNMPILENSSPEYKRLANVIEHLFPGKKLQCAKKNIEPISSSKCSSLTASTSSATFSSPPGSLSSLVDLSVKNINQKDRGALC